MASLGCEAFQILVSPHMTSSTPALPSPIPPRLLDAFAWHHGVASGNGLVLDSGGIFASGLLLDGSLGLLSDSFCLGILWWPWLEVFQPG